MRKCLLSKAIEMHHWVCYAHSRNRCNIALVLRCRLCASRVTHFRLQHKFQPTTAPEGEFVLLSLVMPPCTIGRTLGLTVHLVLAGTPKTRSDAWPSWDDISKLSLVKTSYSEQGHVCSSLTTSNIKLVCVHVRVCACIRACEEVSPHNFGQS